MKENEKTTEKDIYIYGLFLFCILIMCLISPSSPLRIHLGVSLMLYGIYGLLSKRIYYMRSVFTGLSAIVVSIFNIILGLSMVSGSLKVVVDFINSFFKITNNY